MSHSLLQIDVSRADRLGTTAALDDVAPQVMEVQAQLLRREGPGSEMTGWLDLPHRWNEESDRVVQVAQSLAEEIETLIVVGIGGSYLGARAVLEALHPRLRRSKAPRIVFAGHQLEASAYAELLESMDGREVAINVISKSGTTTEPAIAFRLLREKLEGMYGAEKAARRIVATTDASKGALRELAEARGYESFVVPDDVGGRFSVFTPVGLFPLAVAGVDLRALLAAAAAELDRFTEAKLIEDSPALIYSAVRHNAIMAKKRVEVLASFHPTLHYLAEWWKQLFGESEGKQGKGLFPASVDYTTDLHSLGQYLQDGPRMILETFLAIDIPEAGPQVPMDEQDLDGLNYLAGRELAEINALALGAVADAHLEGGAPNLTLRMQRADEAGLGSLLFCFMLSVSLNGKLLGVNPFDQPGVEAYKKKLFDVLGKPGR